MQKIFFENPAQGAGTETMPSENGQVSHEFNNNAKDGLEIVRQPADQVEDKPQANPDSETSEAAPNAGDAEVVNEPQDNSEPTAQEAAEPVGGDAEVVNEPQDNSEPTAQEAAEPVGGDAEVVDEPQDNSEPTAQEAAEPIEGDAEVVDEKKIPQGKNLLSNFKIYSMTKLKALGFKFGKLKINRSIKDRALAAKKKSIKETGLISPCLVVTARQCQNEGLEVCHSDGTKIDDEKEDLGKILIIIDGQHRYEAIRKINSNRKQDEQIECYFYLPLNQDGKTNIISILRESNVATAPWKGGDYLTNILLTAHSDVDLAMPFWVQQRYGDCGDTASWLWATLDPSRVYSKSMIVKASTNQDLLKKVADPTYFDYGKQLYEAALKKFGEKIVKLKVLPLTIISISKKLLAEKSMAEAARILVDFINQIPENSATAIQNFKKDENGTKDVQIERKLNELWETYSNSCGAAKASN